MFNKKVNYAMGYSFVVVMAIGMHLNWHFDYTLAMALIAAYGAPILNLMIEFGKYLVAPKKKKIETLKKVKDFFEAEEDY